jgi:hypothetical protein
VIFHIYLFSQVQDLTKFHKCTEKIKHNLANVLQNISPVNIPYNVSLTVLICSGADMLTIQISEIACKLSSNYFRCMPVLYYSVVFYCAINFSSFRTVTEFHNAHTHRG